jgi:glycolate oxidase
MDASVLALRGIFEEICGVNHVLTDPQELYAYGRDQTFNLHFSFDFLVKPATPEEISAILKVCNQYKIPVTPRGGGSGVTGGALPVRGGVVLSLERLNRIITVNTVDNYLIAEAGAVTADVCTAAEQHGLYFPVAPSSKNFSFVGGNVASNAGSIRSCKYGTTIQYVINLEVVLPDGSITWTGVNVKKNATGLQLTQLFVGSEGTLGIITKVVYRLIPKPPAEVLLLAGFRQLEDACNAVAAINASALAPSATELICENAIRLTAAWYKDSLPLVNDNTTAHLLIEFQEANADMIDHCLEAISAILQQHHCNDILVATSAHEKEQLGKLRFSIGEAMTSLGATYRDVDACIPLGILYDYIQAAAAICHRHHVPMVCFGHALDGNLHTMLLYNAGAGQVAADALNAAADEIYQYVVAHDGVISGEHGIGWLQKKYIPLQFPPARLLLMNSIKAWLDPGNILNPGKMAISL